MQDHFIQTNGIRLHYVEHPGGNPPLVLVPGLTANCRAFDGLVRAGLSPRYRLIAPDMRGRGESDKPDQGYTMADHAADVLGLLDTLGIERAVLGGHSFGGLLSMYIAAHHPQRVAQLVIIDASLGAAAPRTRELIQPALARLGQTYPSFDAFLELIKQAPYFHGWTWDPQAETYYRADVQTHPDGTVQPRSRPASIAAAVEGVLAEDWRAILAHVHQPAILLQAPGPYGPPGAPPIVSDEQARETADLLGDCHVVQVTGNHMTMLYNPGAGEIVSAISQFLDN